jgi:uncharacterized membrane protein YjjP (DUF1212 family)
LEGVSSDEEKIVKSVLKRIEENVRKYSLWGSVIFFGLNL